MSDYRPISLCTVTYKIISKILVLRLKPIIGSVIFESQATFVPGRHIQDNILVAHELIHGLKAKRDCAEKYVAIKTDISKAYDRVEWSFLEEAMRVLGFDERWIVWIMLCVKTVSYSVLINGSAYGNIIPSRGLRQCDSLSPYLFLICVEMLTQMMLDSVNNKEFQGMKLARSCPPVSHLMFTDDSLFFCRATDQDGLAIHNILKEYEKLSGQKVNYDKSSLIFGRKVLRDQRDRLHTILQIGRVGGAGKYLGLPEQFGRSKTEVFQDVVDNVDNKLGGWYNPFLTPAGKEVLIKSVIQAKPVYAMNCFLLPKTITDAITSKVTKFWWGKENGRRKIPWVSWKRLCFSMKEGGLGFRDLSKFNVALLGKQAWRVLQNPNSLLSRIYKGRYYHTSKFLDSIAYGNCSYGWRSIQAGKDLLKQGLRVQIGNGESTKVWEDNWLPTLPPRKALGVNQNMSLRVCDLFKPGTRAWDESILLQLFDEGDIALIQSVHLSRFASHDRYIWPFTKDAQYSVKSGYHFALHYMDEEPVDPPPGSPSIKQFVWKLTVAPKIQHFLWRTISGALPCAARLSTRGVSGPQTCQRCCLEDETINHILFQCQYAQAVWRCAGLTYSNGMDSSLEDNIQWVFNIYNDQHLPSDRILLPCWILWMLWKSRNEFLYANRNVHPKEDADRSVAATNEWIEAHPELTENRGITTTFRSSKWEKPPVGWLKCNFDSTFIPTAEYTEVGWVVRDAHGDHVLSGHAKLRAVTTALQAEALAFIFVFQQIWLRGWRNVWFETDYQALRNIINKSEESLELGTMLDDIQHWTSRLPECSLDATPKEKNVIADKLAKLDPLYSDFHLFHECISFIQPFLYEPYI